MKFLKFTRYGEWWEYKMVPLLTVGYATLLVNQQLLENEIKQLLMLLCAIVFGAIYVSVINDVTDIKEDALAGKKNRMLGVSMPIRGLIIAVCLTIGVGFGYLIYPDQLSLLFFILAYVVFTLYSVPPIRLKKRGILGVFCDAMGAHLFPALIMAANLMFIAEVEYNLFWLIAIGAWALTYGLRGILWHQFYDRDNDIKSNTKTFAIGIDPLSFLLIEKLILGIELIALAIILSNILNLWIVLALVIYAILVLIRKFGYGYEISIIISPKKSGYQLIMNDFYLVFFPISLLLTSTFNSKYGWIILCAHILLFPQKTILVLKDFFHFFKKIISIN
jgi:4-hydroxybenzoate polyprenyltransferase